MAMLRHQGCCFGCFTHLHKHFQHSIIYSQYLPNWSHHKTCSNMLNENIHTKIHPNLMYVTRHVVWLRIPFCRKQLFLRNEYRLQATVRFDYLSQHSGTLKKKQHSLSTSICLSIFCVSTSRFLRRPAENCKRNTFIKI